MAQPRILLIDDNPGDRALVIRVLKQELPDVEIQEILDRSALNRALKKQDFDLVITDFQIRWTTGLDVLTAVKEIDADIPVIMFTNTGTEEIAVEAMKLGLDDYILKQPSRYAFLPPSVRRSLERVEIRRRADLLTDDRFQRLNQALCLIEETSSCLLSDDSPVNSAVDYQNALRQIHENTQAATEVVQELFRYRSSQSADPSSP